MDSALSLSLVNSARTMRALSILHYHASSVLVQSGRYSSGLSALRIGSNVKLFRTSVFRFPLSPVAEISTRNLTSSIKFGQLACISSSMPTFGSGDGGDGRFNSTGGEGGDEGYKGEPEVAKSVTGESDDVAALSPNVIILDVGGMTCGGCAASVKRILESQPQVESARVNLATEIAFVWVKPEVQLTENWKQQIGENLAKHLTSCGFKSTFRDNSRPDLHTIFQRKMDEKLHRLDENGRELAFSWALCAVCLAGHVIHLLGISSISWIHAFHSTQFHLPLSLFALIGPGRRLIFDGLRNLLKGSANMNTLVGLGAVSSFVFSTVAVLVPKLGWKVFFEEPVMLIAFVLLGRNLEQRAKLKAASDMTGLLSILPTNARILTDIPGEEIPSVVDIPCNALSAGDQIIVLPGDRVPVDGVVKAGRSTVDESSLTGEPLPLTKLPGDDVTAGSININGSLTVEVKSPGNETVMADIIRLVEEAQSKEAPVQRLADKVAGNFTYAVMAFSAATFVFWSAFGAMLLPASSQHLNPISMALQLSCNVLVIACPCALGLATPTAMLVGTSLGATRGLLIRGGDVLEKFASVNTILFDKTGTLTLGRPLVSEIFLSEHSNHGMDEIDVLCLAACVESSTIHPVGRAILDSAKDANCQIVKAVDGTFFEEPGSGAVALIGQKQVAVGTFDWLQRHGVEPEALTDKKGFGHHSLVHVGVDGKLAGTICLEDKIRDDVDQVIKYLSRQGMLTHMLSGDRRHAAEHVAAVAGIPQENVISEVKPSEKMNVISKLQRNGQIVAMVGDGVNDAAALASADVGVAMGDGAGAAGDVSGVVLMRNKLSQLIDALELSKLTMQTIKQNLWWAFGYNIVGVPVAAGLLLPFTGTMLTPSIAGALMGLSSIGVMMNSLLLRVKFNMKLNQVGRTAKDGSSQSGSNRLRCHSKIDFLHN